jgi:hypothetical protein
VIALKAPAQGSNPNKYIYVKTSLLITIQHTGKIISGESKENINRVSFPEQNVGFQDIFLKEKYVKRGKNATRMNK